jgi:hypothetical protein
MRSERARERAIVDSMSPRLMQAVRRRSAAIRQRWEVLLRLERISSPLANPDTLVHLMPASIDQILTLAGDPPFCDATMTSAVAHKLPTCDCGYNPYLAFYIAGEQALVEAVVWTQSESADRARESDVAAVIAASRSFARDEIDTFCGMCMHRGRVAHCRFAPATG